MSPHFWWPKRQWQHSYPFADPSVITAIPSGSCIIIR
jgi:hypothetical protein